MAGRPRDTTDEEILAAVAQIHGPVTATDLTDRVGMNRSGVNKRLDDLVDRGLLYEKQVGAKAKVYWLSKDGYEYLA